MRYLTASGSFKRQYGHNRFGFQISACLKAFNGGYKSAEIAVTLKFLKSEIQLSNGFEMRAQKNQLF